MEKLQPKDIIALVLILAFSVFKLSGNNGTLDPVVMLLVGYYFAKRTNGEDSGS